MSIDLSSANLEVVRKSLSTLLEENESFAAHRDKHLLILLAVAKIPEEEGKLDLLRQFLERGVDPNPYSPVEGAIIDHYIFFDDDRSLRLVLEYGADPNHKEYSGYEEETYLDHALSEHFYAVEKAKNPDLRQYDENEYEQFVSEFRDSAVEFLSPCMQVLIEFGAIMFRDVRPAFAEQADGGNQIQR